MEAGSLSQYFTGVGVKSVTGTEVNPSVSRGYEFQDADYGGRGYGARDPEGNVWSFGSYDPFA